MSKHKVKLFEILDKLASLQPQLPYELYLESALLLLKNVEKSFINIRSSKFLSWLLERLSSGDKKLYSQTPCCNIYPFTHFVSFPFQSKEVLGFLIKACRVHVEVEFLKYHLLDKKPDILFVEGSSFCVMDRKKRVTTLYFEIQKRKGAFAKEEIQGIQEELYEIIMKLSTKPEQEIESLENYEFLIKTLRWIMNDLCEGDLPQVYIDFSKQTTHALHFSALVCRIKGKDLNSLDKKLDHPQFHVEWTTTDKRKSIVKEGAILNIEILNTPFLSLLQARKQVSTLIYSSIGTFRDFNGGLLEKIEENFNMLKSHFSAPSAVLREFFTSIFPQDKQATLPPSLLKIIYLELEKQKQNDMEINYAIREEEELISITIKMFSGKFEREWKKSLTKAFPRLLFASLNPPSKTIVNCSLLKPTPKERQQLQEKTFFFYKKWSQLKEVKEILKLCSTSSFASFDPRMGTEEETSYLHKMLFEGLMRLGPYGKPEPAIAEKVEITDAGRCYRFFLRKSYWSNGTPLVAGDFAYSWKMSLTPGFFAPLVYLFNVIENAKAVKEGALSPDNLGIKVISDLILEVKLHHPAPHFLEICTLSLFSPICQKVDIIHPSWTEAQGMGYVCNGPFTLEKKEEDQYVSLRKNPHYWENNQIRLQQVIISILNEEESLSLFRKKQIDALLYPFCRKQEEILREKNPLTLLKGAFLTRYLCMNCSQPPFHNRKIRQALSLALCRQEIVKSFSKEAIPHYTFYSPDFPLQKNAFLEQRENLSLAQTLFYEALDEDPSLKDSLFEQTIYAWQHEALAHLLCKQINKAFGLNWSPYTEKRSTFSQYLTSRKDPLTIFGWINRINDPGYFPQIFFSEKHVVNLSFWTHQSLQSMIEKINRTHSAEERLTLHASLEDLLLQELPMIPLFYTPTYSLCHPNVQGIHSGPFQQFDIRYAYK